MLGAKDQVMAQYGPNSNEVQAMNLKKKIEYARPTRKAKPKTPIDQCLSPARGLSKQTMVRDPRGGAPKRRLHWAILFHAFSVMKTPSLTVGLLPRTTFVSPWSGRLKSTNYHR